MLPEFINIIWSHAACIMELKYSLNFLFVEGYYAFFLFNFDTRDW